MIVMRCRLPSPTSLCPLLLLLLAVVVSLAHRLQVLDIPEQLLVAVVRPDVVNHRAIGVGMLTETHSLGLLAGVCITHQNVKPKSLPPCCLVPGTPRLVLVTLTMTLRFRFLPRCWRY